MGFAALDVLIARLRLEFETRPRAEKTSIPTLGAKYTTLFHDYSYIILFNLFKKCRCFLKNKYIRNILQPHN
jgi:hypothetical protein